MAIIVAHWELPAALLTEKAAKKLLSRWTYTAKAFGITDIRFIAIDKLPPHNDSEVDLKTYDSLFAALKGVDKKRIIYVEEGGKDIKGFKFPEDPVFVFGSDYGELVEKTVSIDTGIALYADIACGIVLGAWSWR